MQLQSFSNVSLKAKVVQRTQYIVARFYLLICRNLTRAPCGRALHIARCRGFTVFEHIFSVLKMTKHLTYLIFIIMDSPCSSIYVDVAWLHTLNAYLYSEIFSKLHAKLSLRLQGKYFLSTAMQVAVTLPDEQNGPRRILFIHILPLTFDENPSVSNFQQPLFSSL